MGTSDFSNFCEAQQKQQHQTGATGSCDTSAPWHLPVGHSAPNDDAVVTTEATAEAALNNNNNNNNHQEAVPAMEEPQPALLFALLMLPFTIAITAIQMVVGAAAMAVLLPVAAVRSIFSRGENGAISIAVPIVIGALALLAAYA